MFLNNEEIIDKKKKIIYLLLKDSNISDEIINKSRILNNPNTDELIEHLYNKINGIDYYKEYNEDDTIRKIYIPNNNKMDINNLKVVLTNDSLLISDTKDLYIYEIDSHYLIYLDGRPLTICKKIYSESEISLGLVI